MTTQSAQILELARARGALRARDLAPLGIPRTVLGRLVAQGALIRASRGVYVRSDADITEHHSLVEVAVRIPGAVINLLSALACHELTDELPAAVWIAVRRGSQAPRIDTPRLELTWTAPRFLNLGVTRHTIEGVNVAVTDPARTVADCFKYRSRVGVDVAVAALRDYLARHRTGRSALWEMAGACRVQRVLRPYLEALS
jgi:predicted transcriptional regulator of viral defense system